MPSHVELDLLLGKSRPAGEYRPRETDDNQRLRVLVLGDFSGRAPDAPSPWHAAALQRIDIDNFDTVLARLVPALSITLPGQDAPAAHLSLRSFDDFEPDALVAHLPLFARLRDLRRRLGDPASFQQAAAELRASEAPGASAVAAPAPAASAEDDRATLERLLGRAPQAAPVAAPPAGDIAARLDRLLREVVAPHVVPDTAHLQQPLIESVDRAIGATLRSLLRHPQWRGVEMAWRGVDSLLRRIDGDLVRIELLDVRADELLQDMAAAGGDMAASSLARLLAQRAEGQGEPARCDVVAALYEFGPSAPELALLAGLGALAAQVQAVLLAAAAPALAGVASSAAPGDPSTWQAQPAARQAWEGLRRSWVARHIGLLFPRVLARLPYGPQAQPVAGFAFDELADGFEHERLAWRPAVLDAVALLAQGHAQDGFALQPDEHLLVEDLPAFVDRSRGEARLQAGAECYLSERQVAALVAQGLMPLVSDRGLPQARLAGWRSVAADGAPLAGAWQV
ncbi:hypothetical protein BurJ1DRAFT_1640 [Burkholderiales bacterium JOSHI_001]|nr:hypothetical protein BurJ1DRAFT_1640 [Burkholderiales bacterium JOSHI_001]